MISKILGLGSEVLKTILTAQNFFCKYEQQLETSKMQTLESRRIRYMAIEVFDVIHKKSLILTWLNKHYKTPNVHLGTKI